MQVKKIHFIETVPGKPVYEMKNGDIRLPFPDGTINDVLWLTEAEVLISLTQKTPENEQGIKNLFKLTRERIDLNPKIIKKA
jgi:hypothetical protein